MVAQRFYSARRLSPPMRFGDVAEALLLLWYLFFATANCRERERDALFQNKGRRGGRIQKKFTRLLAIFPHL